MGEIRLRKVFTCIIVALLCLQAQPAMAYLDPGSGSAIMSAILGAIAAIVFTIKTYWYKIKSVFSGKKDNQELKTDQAQENNK